MSESVNSLAKLIAFNEANAARAMPIFGQQIFIAAQEKGDLVSAEYLQALRDSQGAMRTILDEVLQNHDLDVIVAPVNAPSWKIDWVNGDLFSLFSGQPAAVSGYPSVAVPAGQIADLPIGLTFIGAAFDEADLIQYAYAFEQAADARLEPAFLPRLPLEASADVEIQGESD